MPIPQKRVVSFPTADITDPARAASIRQRELPPTAFAGLSVVVVDLRGKLMSPVSLKEFVVPLGQEIKGGQRGEARLVFLASHPAVAETIDLFAQQLDLPVYIAESPDPADLRRAQPAGALTNAERETLTVLGNIGGQTTVSGFAGTMQMEPSAANNRLVNLEKKGYLFRVQRARRDGDLFIDPRAPMVEFLAASEDAPPMRDALRAQGITTDPYDTSPTTLDADAAERAAELLRRKASPRPG